MLNQKYIIIIFILLVLFGCFYKKNTVEKLWGNYFCDNCGYLPPENCLKCDNCGLCYTPYGVYCVPGGMTGPSFQDNCTNYVHKKFNYTYPMYPYDNPNNFYPYNPYFDIDLIRDYHHPKTNKIKKYIKNHYTPREKMFLPFGS